MAKSKKKNPRKAGRPTLYTVALAVEICKRLAERESLRKICKDPSMPANSTVMGWLSDGKHKEFLEQ